MSRCLPDTLLDVRLLSCLAVTPAGQHDRKRLRRWHHARQHSCRCDSVPAALRPHHPADKHHILLDGCLLWRHRHRSGGCGNCR
jgi:hypothetical protein